MSPKILAALLLLALLPALARAADPPPDLSTSDWLALQKNLNASPEEWSVLHPQLLRIASLRADLLALPNPAKPPAKKSPGIFDGPLGGTALNAPSLPNRPRANAPKPFDPARAPGLPVTTESPLAVAARGMALRALFAAILPDQSRPLQKLLTELQTLLDTPTTPDDALKEKLALTRTLRAKTLRDLHTAQTDLAAYLTPGQLALLIAEGLLD